MLIDLSWGKWCLHFFLVVFFFLRTIQNILTTLLAGSQESNRCPLGYLSLYYIFTFRVETDTSYIAEISEILLNGMIRTMHVWVRSANFNCFVHISIDLVYKWKFFIISV